MNLWKFQNIKTEVSGLRNMYLYLYVRIKCLYNCIDGNYEKCLIKEDERW